MSCKPTGKFTSPGKITSYQDDFQSMENSHVKRNLTTLQAKF
jgi:hypothetical protein